MPSSMAMGGAGNDKPLTNPVSGEYISEFSAPSYMGFFSAARFKANIILSPRDFFSSSKPIARSFVSLDRVLPLFRILRSTSLSSSLHSFNCAASCVAIFLYSRREPTTAKTMPAQTVAATKFHCNTATHTAPPEKKPTSCAVWSWNLLTAMTRAKDIGMAHVTEAMRRATTLSPTELAKRAPASVLAGIATPAGRKRSVLNTIMLGELFHLPLSLFVGSSLSGGNRRSTRITFVARSCMQAAKMPHAMAMRKSAACQTTRTMATPLSNADVVLATVLPAEVMGRSSHCLGGSSRMMFRIMIKQLYNQPRAAARG
mmetsp:Transcript_113781/g.328572  ORF Transcript_113781/g.328572 Transcript_113781/m.328572 type:complete len:315 (-) Transcript_113781:2-946(-)